MIVIDRFERIADILYIALSNTPCACGWHSIPKRDGSAGTEKVTLECQRCKAMQVYLTEKTR